MNAVFADTSGLLALVNIDDENHTRAAAAFDTFRGRQVPLLTTSYVLVESYALLGRRLGVSAVNGFRTDFAPLIDVVWVDEAMHNAGLDLLLNRRRRQLSLVDAVSFTAMLLQGMSEAFAYDPRLEQEGFSLVG